MTTQYREILRLASLGLSGRSIAGSVSCSRNTVSEVLARAVKLGVEWPVPLEVGRWHHVAAVKNGDKLILYLDGQPVGTLFVGIVTPDGEQTHHFRLPGSREEMRQYCVISALDAVRRTLTP